MFMVAHLRGVSIPEIMRTSVPEYMYWVAYMRWLERKHGRKG